MNYDNNNSSFLLAGAAATAMSVAMGIIDGIEHYDRVLNAYFKQRKHREIMGKPTSKRQVLAYIEAANNMAFETAKEHGGFCPYCGYLIIPGSRIIENDVKVTYCPMCNEIISAEDQFHQAADEKSKHLKEVGVC